MKYQHKYIELAKKLDITPEDASLMIICEHEGKNLIPRSRMKKVSIQIDDDVEKRINKICKVLKVSPSAVVSCILLRMVEETKIK